MNKLEKIVAQLSLCRLNFDIAIQLSFNYTLN